MQDKTPYWLHPNDSRYWEHQQELISEMKARFEEANQPIEVTFKFTADQKIYFQQALQAANQFYGTESPTHAIIDICREFLEHGPHQRHMGAGDNCQGDKVSETVSDANEV